MKLNQNEFKSRGFRFEVGEKGAWIELHFQRPMDSLEKHHFMLVDKVKAEVNEQLADDFYMAGLLPFGISTWSDFK